MLGRCRERCRGAVRALGHEGMKKIGLGEESVVLSSPRRCARRLRLLVLMHKSRTRVCMTVLLLCAYMYVAHVQKCRIQRLSLRTQSSSSSSSQAPPGSHAPRQSAASSASRRPPPGSSSPPASPASASACGSESYNPADSPPPCS